MSNAAVISATMDVSLSEYSQIKSNIRALVLFPDRIARSANTAGHLKTSVTHSATRADRKSSFSKLFSTTGHTSSWKPAKFDENTFCTRYPTTFPLLGLV
eukprot:CAMPEP_0184738802 /NCGR_PEP_ID=MMETSP0315-20130426/1510_1 /TAXON_ID=101924 /ORGANISM="Rhodosorus marinus, Strain UTEX LB 2760" /LENGTH=99 /DNA_ID=CAMNT_0027206861 /DNA_START=73 /DNA_END=369 /DNA_ORIENTATION=+